MLQYRSIMSIVAALMLSGMVCDTGSEETSDNDPQEDVYMSIETNQPDTPAATHVSRLTTEQSAYLRSAAHQPVDWYPWGDEAFARARELDRPVLLDIGAVWCHWCHVIDRESYENVETARLINDLFVAIKVDRDERPEIDARYQQAVQTISGQGDGR